MLRSTTVPWQTEPHYKTTGSADAMHCELTDLLCLAAMHRGTTKQIRQQAEAGSVCLVYSVLSLFAARRTQLAVEIKQ